MGEVWEIAWDECGKVCWNVGEMRLEAWEGKVRGDVGEVWESVWGECGKVCWGGGGNVERGIGGVGKGKRRCVGVKK